MSQGCHKTSPFVVRGSCGREAEPKRRGGCLARQPSQQSSVLMNMHINTASDKSWSCERKGPAQVAMQRCASGLRKRRFQYQDTHSTGSSEEAPHLGRRSRGSCCPRRRARGRPSPERWASSRRAWSRPPSRCRWTRAWRCRVTRRSWSAQLRGAQGVPCMDQAVECLRLQAHTTLPAADVQRSCSRPGIVSRSCGSQQSQMGVVSVQREGRAPQWLENALDVAVQTCSTCTPIVSIQITLVSPEMLQSIEVLRCHAQSKFADLVHQDDSVKQENPPLG